jgi:hypothetical protein
MTSKNDSWKLYSNKNTPQVQGLFSNCCIWILKFEIYSFNCCRNAKEDFNLRAISQRSFKFLFAGMKTKISTQKKHVYRDLHCEMENYIEDYKLFRDTKCFAAQILPKIFSHVYLSIIGHFITQTHIFIAVVAEDVTKKIIYCNKTKKLFRKWNDV